VRRRSRGRFWLDYLATTALLYAGVWGVLAVNGAHAQWARLALLVALGTAVLALVNVGSVNDGPDWSVESIQPLAPPGQDTRLAMYTRVISGHLDARTPDGTFRDRVADLADRRLRQRHGVGLADPRARTLLGDEVADILRGPPRRLSREQIDRCVTTIEEL
jgi:hypothetical protein